MIASRWLLDYWHHPDLGPAPGHDSCPDDFTVHISKSMSPIARGFYCRPPLRPQLERASPPGAFRSRPPKHLFPSLLWGSYPNLIVYTTRHRFFLQHIPSRAFDDDRPSLGGGKTIGGTAERSIAGVAFHTVLAGSRCSTPGAGFDVGRRREDAERHHDDD